MDKLHDSISNLYRLVKSQPSISKQHMNAVKVGACTLIIHLRFTVSRRVYMVKSSDPWAGLRRLAFAHREIAVPQV